ncbi:MAG: ABC transporter ATP-binding protein [Desulfurococcales archaeon]|nr:ABC transporter ATP-binding protein [Desulfurococcales archaeon]
MPGVEVYAEKITKTYKRVTALREVTLKARRGHITTLLGPSGCGKTTLLKVIAGLEKPTSGKIYFDGEDVTGQPPEKRNIGFVFQDLALFPHLNVYENIAFGLRIRRYSDAEIKRRVYDTLELVGLDPGEFASRRINELSGGQQQRVALARALVIEPAVLLLDEPFAHLDYKIKQRLLLELKRIQRETATTVIYVTHDQNEAMAVSHEIAVMRDGVILQVGAPEEVYESPRSAFVASFFGEANVLPLGDGRFLVVRPERVRVNPERADVEYEGVVEDVIFQGPLLRLEVRVNGKMIKVIMPRNGGRFKPGARVRVGWRLDDARVVSE